MYSISMLSHKNVNFNDKANYFKLKSNLNFAYAYFFCIRVRGNRTTRVVLLSKFSVLSDFLKSMFESILIQILGFI